MATTISTAASNVQDRLILGATSQEPTSAHIQTWLRDGFRHLLGVLPPVTKQDYVVLAGTTEHFVTLPNDSVWAVMHATDLLIPGEYGVRAGGINFQRGGIDAGDTVTIYYTKYPTITSSTASIETTCEFGPDWLEEPAKRFAVARCYERLANTAPSQDGDRFAGQFRVAEESYQAAVQGCFQRWQEFKQWLVETRGLRLSPFGNRPLMESAGSGFENLSEIKNSLWT